MLAMPPNAHPDLAPAAAEAAGDAMGLPAPIAAPAPRPAAPQVPLTVAERSAAADATRADAPPCRRTLVWGYVLVIAGTALVRVPPVIPSALAGQLLLAACLAAILGGAVLVTWGFVRDVFRPR